MGLDDGVVRGERLELVGRGDEVVPRHLADFGGHGFREADERVYTGAHGRAALRQHLQPRQSRLHPLDAEVELLDVAGEFLAQRQRRGVLQVCAPDLDDLGELLALFVQRVAEALERGEQLLFELTDGGDVHDGRERVV